MPNLMNLDQARGLVNPILTDLATGYTQAPLIADKLFPRVPVGTRAGQVLGFGKESFKVHNTKRAPGEHIPRINVGYALSAFKLEQHALGVTVPVETQEEALNVQNVDLFDESLSAVIASVRLEIEQEAAVLATNAANYGQYNKETLSNTSQWSHADSDPFTAFANAKEQVRSKVGARANIAVIGPKVLVALQKHPLVLDRLKYTSSQIPSEADLARLFQLDEIVVAEAVSADANDAFVDVWGKNVVIAYVARGSKSRKNPSFGYNYELKGSPVVTEPYFDRKTRSFEAEYIYEHGLYLTAADAGFLYSAAVA